MTQYDLTSKLHLAKNLRTLRIARKLSQVALATKAGIALRNYKRVEAGEIARTVDTVDKLAGALGIAPAALLMRTKVSVS